MKHLLHLFLCIALMLPANSLSAKNEEFGRKPLASKSYSQMPLGSIHAEGWLLQQLQLMKSGMTGHLDTLYPEVMGPRNGWLGGDGDVWERGPYWIDGLLPLAYILDDAELKAKVQPWIEWTLASQQEDGYFGPAVDREYEAGLQRNNSHDWWPKMVVLKVLQQYYNATGDERVIPFLLNYFKYQLAHLPETHLDNWTYWGMMRGGDNTAVVLWLYNLTGEKSLLDLADILHKQTYDWTGEFLARDMLHTPFTMHCVNLGQGFKEPVIYYQRNKDPKQIEAVKTAEKDIRQVIGFPTGLWAGDELTRVGNPTQGSELCTAVEMMFSLESILEITGDRHWADYLERVAYNALPTQITDAFDARQYYQQTNQIKLTYEPRNFCTNYRGTDQLMGLRTGYPCCTSNLHQGWPKLVQNLWYKTEDGGVAALVYGPSSVDFKAGNKAVHIKEVTSYPMEENVRFEVTTAKKAKFSMQVRIPEWSTANTILVNGQPVKSTEENGIVTIARTWKNGDVLTLAFTAPVKVSRWFENSAVIERGPLVYALKMNESWERKEMPDNYKVTYGPAYYEVQSTTPWNWGLIEKDLEDENIAERTEVVRNEVAPDAYFWNVENAPLSIKISARRIPFWTEYNGSAGPIPYSPLYNVTLPEPETIELIPYGCTTLRIAEFPTIW